MVDPDPNKEYEATAGRLLSALAEQQFVRTNSLEQRKKVDGKTTRHEIDIWWEFEAEGSIRVAAFQCRNLNSRIKQEAVFAFKAILEDLPGEPVGIMVTKTGYQRGAKRVAEAHGIRILELREPSDKDWEGRVRKIHITLVASVPRFRNFALELAPEVGATLKAPLAGISGDMVFFEADQLTQSTTMAALLEQSLPSLGETTDWTLHRHEFDRPTFLRTGHESQLTGPVKAVRWEVSVQQEESVVEVNADDLVRYILKDVLTDEVVLFDPSGRPRPNP
jgi:hypothetical protein